MLCLGRKSKRSRIAQQVSQMFVSDSNIFSPQLLKLCIINGQGADWQLDVTPDFSIDKLKVMALGHFLNPVESIKVAGQYKLVLVSEGRSLADESTVQQENVKENDELLLLKRRKPAPSTADPQEDRDHASKGPDEGTIAQVTSEIIPQNTTRITEDSTTIVDFQTELRKILISLVDASQKILCKNPDVLPIFKSIQDKVEDQTGSDVDPTIVKQLTDMGFPESKAIKALKLNKMSPVEAMEWLLEHNLDSDLETSALDRNISNSTEITTSYQSSDGVDGGTSSGIEKMATSPPPSPSRQSIPQRKGLSTVSEILEKFKAYKRKGFRPNVRALHNLKEMGFAEDEVVDALRITGNIQDAACEWLLGDRRPTAEEMEKGLDPDGPIYKAIISNPIVQLGLNNPKTLLAFLHMLENPNTANHWLNDPDTAPLLSQIFRIYHAEKHSLQMHGPNMSNS